MRAPVASLSRKLISIFLAATLAMGLVPIAAFADDGALDGANAIGGPSEEPPTEGTDPSIDDADGLNPVADASASGEDVVGSDVTVSDDSNLGTPILAGDVINHTMPLSTVAQAESTRSYFLAQTLESTKTVPVVSAKLPLDSGANQGSQAGADGGQIAVGSEDKVTDGDLPTASTEAGNGDEAEGGEDSDESDLAGAVTLPGVAAESTVVGSFEYLGMTFAVEPGGESVALVAVDYSKLPEEFIQKQVIVIPDMATPDGLDYYSVTRIADGAFAGLTKDNANPDYTGCIELFSDEELLAEAGISQEEVQEFLNAEPVESGPIEPSDDIRTIVSMDGNVATLDDGSTYTFTNPLAGCTGILALGIPASVSSIEDEAFFGFETLQYLVVSDDDPEFASYDGALYSADLTNLRLIPEGRVGAVRVASSATSVDPEVFSHCPSVDALVADAESDLFISSEVAVREHQTASIVIRDEQGDRFPGRWMLFWQVIDYLRNQGQPNESVVLWSDAESSNVSSRVLYAADDWYIKFISNGDGVYIDGSGLGVDYVRMNAASYYMTAYGSHLNFRVDYGNSGGGGILRARKTGYTQTEWVCSNGARIGTTSDNTGIHPTGSGQSFTAYWRANTYTVAYDANSTSGVSGTTASSSHTYDTAKSLTTNGFKKVGHTFKNWNTKADGSGTSYGDGASVSNLTTTDKGEVKLYAQWSANDITLTWDSNGGSVVSATKQTFSENAKVSLPAAPTRAGYEFKGWFTSTTSSSQITNDTALPSSSTTYYAQWTRNSVHTLTLDKNGGDADKTAYYLVGAGYTTALASDAPVAVGGQLVASSNLPTKAGYTFKGYYSAVSDGSQYVDAAGKLLAAGNNVALTGDATWYAQWTANSYTIEYDGNGSDGGSTASTSAVYDADVTFAKNGFSRTGYEFKEWNTEPDGSGASYSAEAKYTAPNLAESGAVTLYAVWKARSYTVSFDGGGGTGGQVGETVTATYDAALPSIATAPPALAGYEFAGWWDEGFKTKYYTESGAPVLDAWKVASDTTLHAKWTKVGSYSVDLTDPTFQTDAQVIWYWPGNGYVAESQDSTDLVTRIANVPSVDDYEFSGYFDGPGTDAMKMIDESGNIVASDAPDGNVTWYAHWKRLACPVELRASYGDWDEQMVSFGTLSLESITFGEPFNSEATWIEVPTRTGYTFMGYWSRENRDVAATDPESAYEGVRWIDAEGMLTDRAWVEPEGLAIESAAVLYAAWRRDAYTIDFDLTPIDDGAEPVQEHSLAPLSWRYGEQMEEVTFPLPNRESGFYRNGYSFLGWAYYDDDDELVRVYDAKTEQGIGTYEREKGAVLRALWEPIIYTVVFDWNHDGAGRYTYEVAYDSDVTFTKGEIESEKYLDYELVGWKTVDGRELVFDENGAARFHPSSAHALPREVVYYAQWKAPDAALITLYADAHCSLPYADGGGVYSFRQEYGHEVALRDPRIGLDPRPDVGYDFICWQRIATGDDGRPLEKDGAWIIAEASVSAIDAHNTEDVYLVAHTAAHSCSVTLQPGADEDGKSVPRADVTYPGWDHEGDVYEFDISDFTGADGAISELSVPDAQRAGYSFLGWKLRGGDDEPKRGLVIDPAEISGSVARHRIYDAVWAPKAYEVVFVPNRDDIDEERSAAETIVLQATMGDAVDIPYPATRGNGLVFTGWTGTSNVDPGASVVFYDARTSVAVSELLRVAGEQEGIDRIVLYAQWNRTISVTAPLYATIAIDPESGDMVASENMALVSRYGSSTNVPTLEVVSVRYDKLMDDQQSIFDPTSQSAHAFATNRGKVYLTVYAGASEKPDLSRGASEAPEPSLRIDLANSVTIPKSAADIDAPALDKASGFAKRFMFDGDSLPLYYGLDFEGVEPREFIDSLPTNDAAGANGWSSQRYSIARIYYTIGLAA